MKWNVRFQHWTLASTTLLVVVLTGVFLVAVFGMFTSMSEDNAEERFALIAQRAAGKRPAVDMSVISHPGTIGKAEQNESLALKRANAVAELLKSKGLKVHALSVESHGERNLLVRTPDETAEPRNRRVEISIR